MTEPTFILGGWQSDFAQRAPDGDVYELIRSATLGALDDADVEAADVEVGHVGNLAAEIFNGQAQLGGMLVAIDPVFDGLPTSRHEAACASGSVATVSAMAEIEAGRYDVALVVGAEVLRNVPGQRAGEILGCAAWAGREIVDEPFPWPHQFSEVAAEYDRRYGLEHKHLGRIAELNFENGRRNPNAQTREWDPASLDFGEDDQANPMVAAPIRKNDCGRITDGSAAVVLASRRYAEGWAARRGIDLAGVPRITGWGHATGSLLLADKLERSSPDGWVFPHVRRAIEDAFERSGAASIKDLDSLELHDCTTLTEYVLLDHFGVAERGHPYRAIEDGTIDFGGPMPVNPSGGLMALGHPVGATGVRMVWDSAKQVTGRAGEYQVDGARRVATLNVGGSFTTAVSFVVEAGA